MISTVKGSALSPLVVTNVVTKKIILCLSIMALFACQSSSDPDTELPEDLLETEPDPNAEFIAELDDFDTYQSWQAVDYAIGPTNTFLGSAHEVESSAYSRKVFANATALEQTGDAFPKGSILVKEVLTNQGEENTFAEMGGLLAMVKRGGEFNPDHDGWEWIVLNPDLSQIVDRGANLMAGACNDCHQAGVNDQASSGEFGGVDYVFAHKSEFVAQNADFADYLDWTQIDDLNEVNTLLGGMAHGAAQEDTVRRVFKKQLYANPDSLDLGYPIGTVLLKEVSLDNTIIAITAMVKRGGTFNSENNGWEWFMLDPASGEIALDDNNNPLRGADLLDNACNACHLAANPTSGHGTDFVFKHGGDPFNNNEEFVASLQNFTNYMNWPVVDYTIGDVTTLIGGGHQGQNASYARTVFANPEAVSLAGEVYAKGAILVKEVFSWESGEKEFSPQLGLVAMVKRAGDFNAEHNGWEWFELETDLSGIIGRGGNYRGDGCNNCHSQTLSGTRGEDYVFAHPSEYIAENADFSDYLDWPKIDERDDDNSLLGGMAHQAGTEGSVRHVYKKQLYAKAEGDLGYPVGTIVVKATNIGTDTVELTAMVKRGGEDFNTENNGWEWFMLDPDTAEIADGTRGADLLDGACNNCHKLATDALGMDYIFEHANDPFAASP